MHMVMLKVIKRKLFDLFDQIIYFKNDELILTSGNSGAIDDGVQIEANNFKYNKLSEIIYAYGDVKIDNQKENYLIYSDQIIYNKKSGKIKQKITQKLFLKVY